jgi:hypothetical protein
MIRHSFIFLSGIGERRERRLWESGILSWEDFLERERINIIPERRKPLLDMEIKEAKLNLELRIPHFFAYRMPRREHWRLYEEFRHSACFLDIETTGLSPAGGEVTLVGVYDGREYKAFIRGINLNEEVLERELKKYSLLVTFYGSCFDVPFLKAHFPNIGLEKPHIDLCFASRRLGLRGGLKRIEEVLGLEREEEVKDIDGFEAVRLWKRWERCGDSDALETLVEYNRTDVVNLKPLAEYVYMRLKDGLFKDGLLGSE